MMVEKGTYWIPTFAIHVKLFKDKKQPKGWIAAVKETDLYRDRAWKLARKYGVKIACGTDASVSCEHGENAMELELMVKWGMSEMEALVTATRNSAETLGLLGSLGTIEPGKLADIIVVDGDPLKDIAVLRRKENIKLVMKSGEVERAPDSNVRYHPMA